MIKKGISLIEYLVAISVFTIVSAILVVIFVSGWRVFHQESASIDTQGQAKLITSTVIRHAQQADRILESRTFGSDSYTSSSNILILELPSVDENDNIIEGSYDFEVFYQDPIDSKKLKITIEAASGSIRRSETKTLSNLVSNLTFIYKKGGVEVSPQEAEIVTVRITASQTSFGKIKETKLVGQAKLRNK